jgi:hypothetical protein
MKKKSRNEGKKKAKAHAAAQVPVEEVSQNADAGPRGRGEMSMLDWLLAPAQVKGLRRRLINGTAPDLEVMLRAIAYSTDVVADDPYRRIRFATFEQYVSGEHKRSSAKYLNAPPGYPKDLPHDPRKVPLTWGTVDAEKRRVARELIEDPKYQTALQRRIRNGGARAVLRQLWRVDGKPPEQAVFARDKTFYILSDYTPFLKDPLEEQERILVERQATTERLEQEQRASAAAAPTEEVPPGAETLELVRDL